MMKDKALEDLFLAQRPIFQDQDEFMNRLSRRLEAVEYIRRYEEANIRRYKYALVLTFLLGMLLGGGLLAFVLSLPADAPLFTWDVSSRLLQPCVQYGRIILTGLLSMLISASLFSIVSNVQDIFRMRLPHHTPLF